MEHKGIGCKCEEVRRWLPTQETQASIGAMLRKKKGSHPAAVPGPRACVLCWAGDLSRDFLPGHPGTGL